MVKRQERAASSSLNNLNEPYSITKKYLFSLNTSNYNVNKKPIIRQKNTLSCTEPFRKLNITSTGTFSSCVKGRDGYCGADALEARYTITSKV